MGLLSFGPWRALSLLVLLIAAAGCGDDEPPEPPPPPPPGATWTVVGTDLEAALLSVGGTSARDVWAVGGDAAGREGLVLHFDGSAWSRIPSETPFDLWWVHAIAPDDVYIGGAGGTILRWDGRGLARQPTPGLASATVFGMWASGPDDVWAVGGVSGRYGFIWHHDGTGWTDVPLPDDVPLDARGELPALFKVWGRSADDIYAVGGNGLVLRYDGTTWTVVPTQTEELLFTVHGNDEEVVIVGGANNGIVLDGAGVEVGPTDAPLLQGAVVGADGTAWASGANGAVYRREGDGAWGPVEGLPEGVRPESLHAIWVDPDGGVWSVGGGVLSPALDAGVMLHLGADDVAAVPEAEPLPPLDTRCPEARVDIAPEASIARRWNELLLDAIRRDIPRPTQHARNLFHTSVAMYDAWAAYDEVADGYLIRERLSAPNVAEARRVAISYAAYRVMRHRYAEEVGGVTSADCFDRFLRDGLGLDPDDDGATGDEPRALGNRIGQAVIDAFRDDGANEAEGYADTTMYSPTNAPLVVDRPGTGAVDPDVWQELNLAQAETQNGIVIDAGRQDYIGPNWGFVTPFALPGDPEGDGTHWDRPDADPALGSTAEKQAWAVEVIRYTAELDQDDGVMRDISPARNGNNRLGANDGTGHGLNPVTGLAYAPNLVPRGDYGRVLAEFWADGPDSETPPGHWNTIANAVTDTPGFSRQPYGRGPVVDPLEWDVKLYLALNGAVHDAAIVAWGMKRKYLSARPITLIRDMAERGQATDPERPSYDPEGLPLVEGLVELITEESAAVGARHHHLRWWRGQIAVRSWRGEPGDRANSFGGVGWIRAVDWIPYQRRTFVTPAFPGFVSGHSTFSRAAAEVLARVTGSPFFPNGLGEFVARRNRYLVFEQGPSAEIRLQWATYADAADQAGQSRLWGGIHIVPDDFVGRELGALAGIDAADLARTYFEGTAVP
ncbi:MAG: vanadium-dependent haloperoxidase [Myxococcota bacterium]